MLNNEYYQKLIEKHFPDRQSLLSGISIKDLESRYLYINEHLLEEMKFVNAKDFAIEDIINHKDSEFYEPSIASRFTNFDKEVIKEQKAIIKHVVFQIRSTKTIYSIMEKRPLYHDGELIGVIAKINYLNVFILNDKRVILSKRELDILVHTLFGMPFKYMSRVLDISLGTISTYSQRLRAKLGYDSQLELTKIINHHGLSPYALQYLAEFYPDED